MDPAPFTRYIITFFATIVGIIAVVWAYTATLPMAFMESGYASWTAKKTLLRQCQLGQITFFGDSRLEAGLRPLDLPIPATNLGLAAGTAIETRIAVDRALTSFEEASSAVDAAGVRHAKDGGALRAFLSSASFDLDLQGIADDGRTACVEGIVQRAEVATPTLFSFQRGDSGLVSELRVYA